MEKILFLNEKDRNAKDRNAKSCNAKDCNVGRAPEHRDYRYYNVKPVVSTGSKLDVDGFIKPRVMFRPVREVGLLSELRGDTPIRRYLDIRMNLDLLMKESYEHMIELLMCDVRQKEVCCQLHYAKEDREWERYISLSEKGRQVDMPQVTPEEHRRLILNAITWKYDWIQQNKKQCYQFAEAVIESKRGNTIKDPSRSHFLEQFIKYAAGLPETNRNLIDEMYEMAWHVIQIYRYGADPDRVPEPWYDTVCETGMVCETGEVSDADEESDNAEC